MAPHKVWTRVGSTSDFPAEGGAAIRYGYMQLAIFHFTQPRRMYATQNMCPHKREFVLSRGSWVTSAGEPKVACPMHKKTFLAQDRRLPDGRVVFDSDIPVEGRRR